MKKGFVSGFVSIIGRPNVGKSTLMNFIVGEKVAIMSNKPQTTRNKIRSVLTKEDFQMIFIDTPGIHKPKTKLGEYMVDTAERTLNEVDVVLMLIEPTEEVGGGDRYIIERLQSVSTPVVLVINKVDTVPRENLLAIIDAYKDLYPFKAVVPISAKKGTNVEELLQEVKTFMPEGPMFFPEHMISDQPEKQLIAEVIREKALHLLNQEIPHGLAVEITQMQDVEEKDLIDIHATIYCEREGHKRIIIGKQGQMLKEIGKRARYDIERLLGNRIYLNLWVKVKEDWRNSQFLLNNFGYDKNNR